jgi:hypothetical protein
LGAQGAGALSGTLFSTMTLTYPLRSELRDLKPTIYRDVLVDLFLLFGIQSKKTYCQKRKIT